MHVDGQALGGGRCARGHQFGGIAKVKGEVDLLRAEALEQHPELGGIRLSRGGGAEGPADRGAGLFVADGRVAPMGELAGAMLASLMQDGDAPTPGLMPTALSIRGTTGPPPSV